MKSRINLITPYIVLLSFVITTNTLAQTPENKTSSEDYLHHTIQVSFLPYIGTVGFLSNQVTCDLSLNILAGYVKEVHSAEFGGLFNLVRKNAGKCQIAGLGNMVGGTSYGLQCAGIINLSKNLKGIQFAGNINFAGNASGMQIAGLLNQANKGKCSQISGLVNNANEASVFQIAGLLNNSSKVESFQIAGWANNTKDSIKLQIAGLANNTNSNTKIQIAGLVNNASGVANVQISGLVNRTSFLKGVQIGFLNISDSCQGIPIGVINLVKNGYHKIEISGDEMFYTNVAFRSGIKKLHSILIAGIQPDNFNSSLWTYGCGFGSSFSLNEKTLIDIDATFQHIIKEDYVGNNYLYKLAVGIDHQLRGKTSVYIGATYNFLVTDTKYSKYTDKFSSIAPYHFTNHTNNNGFNLKSWAGIKVGLRFL